MTGIHAVLAATLFVSPGAWLAFTVCDPATTSVRVRWALAVMLSPACFALQVVALSACGVAFATTVSILAYANLAALALPFVRRSRAPSIDVHLAPPPAWLTIATWIALFAPIAYSWIRSPEYRVYGWHNAMNTAIAYRVAELPEAPEDPDLAGVRLNYGWLGHVQTTGIARIADVAPTLVFPVLNGVMLLATLVFLEAALAAFRPRHRASATLTSGLVLAGTMITGLVVHRLVPPEHPNALLHELSGDLRVAPILTKFHNFDAMVIGIAGFAALVYFVVASWTARTPRAWLLLAIVVTAIGLSYPLLFPFAGLALAVVWATLFMRTAGGERNSLQDRRWSLAIACAIACALVLVYIALLGKDRDASLLESFHAIAITYAVITMIHVLGIWLWIAWPSISAALRTRTGPQFQLTLALLALVAVALVLQMRGDTHYKVYFAQVLVLAPLMVGRVDGWLVRSRGAVLVLSVCVIALSVTTARWIQTDVPDRARARTVQLDESSFAIRPPASPVYDWIRSIRERTDRDTIVVAPPSDLPLAELTERSQFVSMHPPGDTLLGYSLEMRFLFENKGYRPELVVDRQRLVETCYLGKDGDAAFPEVTAKLRSLGRPIAIAFPARGNAYQRWLAAQSIGGEIHRDETALVWAIAR